MLQDLLPRLKEQENYSNDALYEILETYAKEKGFKTGLVIWPVRVAVSGKLVTPAGATQIMEVIGKEETLRRIEKGIELLQA